MQRSDTDACSVTSIQVNGSGTATTTLSITTTARTVAELLPHKLVWRPSKPYFAFVFFWGAPLAMFRRHSRWPASLILVLVIAGLSGCGGSSGNSGSGSSSSGTPAGTYSISVTSQCFTASHTFNLSVIVQ
jgi:hypothetical protein